MGWTTPWAPTAAELDACVECGLCLPHCPTFRLTGDETASPRGRLNAMAAVSAGILPLDRTVAGVFQFCLQCRACEAACPSLVPFGRAMEGARAEVAAVISGSRMRRRLAGRWVGRRRLVAAVTNLAALGQRFGAARWLPGRLGRGLRGMRRLSLRTHSRVGTVAAPAGESRGTVGLLAGCVMDPWFDGVHRALTAVLLAAGYRVVVPTGQTCCGALAAHEGLPEAVTAMGDRNRSAFAGVDLVVVAAAGCSAHLAAHPIGAPVEDAVVTVARLLDEGRLPVAEPDGRRVGVHDPCHHRQAQRIVAAPRTIVRAAGHDPVELDPDAMCCGAAGLWSLGHPAESGRLGRRAADTVVATGVATVVSANPGCEMQLRAHLGAQIRIAHPVEVYAAAVGLV